MPTSTSYQQEQGQWGLGWILFEGDSEEVVRGRYSKQVSLSTVL